VAELTIPADPGLTGSCSAYPTSYPVATICGGYVVRDPWSAVYPSDVTLQSYTFESKGSISEWKIDHNLGFYPNATTWAKDPDGKPSILIVGAVKHTNDKSLVITFNQPVDGIAYLS
jgi:hypothetical protein